MSSTEETARVRRAENEKAAGIVGAKTANFDFLDCIYRRGLHGEALYRARLTRPTRMKQICR